MIAEEFMRCRRARLRLVVFDCDGVLVDSEPVANRVTAAVLTEAGWPMGPEEAERRFIGLAVPDMMPLVEAHLGHSLPAGWLAAYTARLTAAMAAEAAPVPGAIAALDAVTALGVAWRVASNSSHAEMRAKFGRIGLGARVQGRVHSFTDVARGKPAPDIYLAAAAAEGTDPENCLVIEDSVAGATAARAAGMGCLGYAPHGDGDRLRAAGAVPFAAMAELPLLFAIAAGRA